MRKKNQISQLLVKTQFQITFSTVQCSDISLLIMNPQLTALYHIMKEKGAIDRIKQQSVADDMKQLVDNMKQQDGHEEAGIDVFTK